MIYPYPKEKGKRKIEKDKKCCFKIIISRVAVFVIVIMQFRPHIGNACIATTTGCANRITLASHVFIAGNGKENISG